MGATIRFVRHAVAYPGRLKQAHPFTLMPNLLKSERALRNSATVVTPSACILAAYCGMPVAIRFVAQARVKTVRHIIFM